MIDVAAALAGITRLAFDTAPIIYLIEQNPRYWSTVNDIFHRIDFDSDSTTQSDRIGILV